MYEIAVCDDDAAFLSAFADRLGETLQKKDIPFHLHTFSHIQDLQRSIESGRKFSLLFLDIFFDTEQGIRFGKFLREHNDNTDIIYMTTLPAYAADSYDVSPLHFLVKPIDQEKLETALARFLDRHSPLNLHFATARGHLFLPLNDILFFEIYSHKIIIHLTNRSQETCIGTLKELEHLLPAHIFLRPHRSYLVNINYISGITRYRIHLSSGDTIPVSKELYNQIQNSFIDFAGRRSISL